MKFQRLYSGVLLTIASAVGFAYLPSSFSKSSPWDTDIRSGRIALEQGDFERAEQLLKSALDDSRKFKDDDPRMGVTLHSMGDLYLRQQNYSLAKEYFERALASEQKFQGAESIDVAEDLYGLAVCGQQLGDHLAAEIFLKRVDEIWKKKLGPTHPRLLSVLPAEAAYASMKDNFAQAEICYRDIVKIQEKELGADNPQLGPYLNLLSTTLGNEGKLAEAREVASRAVRLLKNSSQSSIAIDSAEDNLAVLEKKSEPESTIKQEAVAKPEPVIRQELVAKAETIAKPIEDKPVVAKASLPSKKIANNTEIRKEPIAEVSNKNDLDSNSLKPWQLDKTKKDNTEQALSDRSKQWGKVRYLTGGRLVSAEEYKAMLLASSAYEMMKQEKYRLAVDILNKALLEYPNLASAHTNIGLALSRLGNSEEAREHLKTSIAINPNRSAPWLNLASSFQNTGELKEAIETYSEYLKRFPSDRLAEKGRILVKHLQEELDTQNAVAKRMAANPSKSSADYFLYATNDGVVKWTENKMPIKVYIANGSQIPGYKSEYEGLCLDAFKQWSNASSGWLKFEYVKKQELADIVCDWTNDFSKVASPTEGGEAQVTWTKAGIQHGKITILTIDPNPDSPISQKQIQSVCLHEIGHCLGLIGHSPTPKDIMYCTMPQTETKFVISERDSQTLHHLYSN